MLGLRFVGSLVRVVEFLAEGVEARLQRFFSQHANVGLRELLQAIKRISREPPGK